MNKLNTSTVTNMGIKLERCKRQEIKFIYLKPIDAITSSFSFITVSSISRNFSMNAYFVYAYKISRLSMLNYHKHLTYVQIPTMLKTLFTSI